MFTARVAVLLAFALAVALPAAAPASAFAPAAINVGPLDVTGVSFTTGSFVDAATGEVSPVGVHGVATVGAVAWTTYDELLINVRPAGGEWDRSLDFPHSAQPVGLGRYYRVMLSSSRAFPPGNYEARVAARQGETWVYDEVVSSFTMP